MMGHATDYGLQEATSNRTSQAISVSEVLESRALSVREKYKWTEEVLKRFRYHRLKNPAYNLLTAASAAFTMG